jgi:hypothetical protein
MKNLCMRREIHTKCESEILKETNKSYLEANRRIILKWMKDVRVWDRYNGLRIRSNIQHF